MTLSEKQSIFAGMVARLILHAEALGYRVTFSHAERTPGCRNFNPRSLHTFRLAVDLNLYIQDAAGRWRYQRTTRAHEPLGRYWESIGGEWGGAGSRSDGNHYSLGHQGRW